MASSWDLWLKGLAATSIKLTGKSFLLWSQAFETFLGAHRKICHITHPPPDVKDVTYEDWLVDDCAVISWLVNSMDEGITRSVMMMKSAKTIWDTLRSTYGNEQSVRYMSSYS